MRILILGGDGMIGHQLLRQLIKKHDVKVTLRKVPSFYQAINSFSESTSYFEVDATEFGSVEAAINDFNPDVLINAIGVIKQKLDESDPSQIINAINVNATFPHLLAQLCKKSNIKLVQISSDCVFSGEEGNYNELAQGNASDLYGRTKYIGEVAYDNCLTLRTSTIGLELYPDSYHGLLEWFLAQRGEIFGYENAIYTGLTTIAFARVVEEILTSHFALSGLYQVASDPITKYDLLSRLNILLGRGIKIKKNVKFFCDRSLSYQKLQSAMNYQPLSWDSMLVELAEQIKLQERCCVFG